VCVSQRDLCRKTKREKKRRWNSLYVFFCLCVYGSRFSLSTLLLLFFVSCCCVPNCVFCFFYAATITAAAAVFLSLFIKRLCVCVSAFIICCVFACVRAGHSFYFVVLCLLFSFIKNSLIYSQLKRKNQQLYYLSFCVLVCSYLHGCCVCVWFFFC